MKKAILCLILLMVQSAYAYSSQWDFIKLPLKGDIDSWVSCSSSDPHYPQKNATFQYRAYAPYGSYYYPEGVDFNFTTSVDTLFECQERLNALRSEALYNFQHTNRNAFITIILEEIPSKLQTFRYEKYGDVFVRGNRGCQKQRKITVEQKIVNYRAVFSHSDSGREYQAALKAYDICYPSGCLDSRRVVSEKVLSTEEAGVSCESGH